MNNMQRTEITDDLLKKEELQLFEFIRDVIKSSGCNSIVRVVGGWLMGRESDDIDLVVDNMSGGDFGNIVKNEQHKSESNEQNTKKVKVIKSNPNQHKFVATATVTMFGFKLEITSLRPHTGGEELGTASSDALERDFTFNSLFYNINEKKVEDFTGQGIHDIAHEGIIRTPMDPLHTLGRDPLRSLRCVRFAARFAKHHFTIHESLRNAILSPEIHKELMSNITRPRIYTELTKMLNGAFPIYAMKLIFELNLHTAIFSPPPEDSNVNSSDDPFWTAETSSKSHLSLFVFERLVINDTGSLLCTELSTSIRVLLLSCVLISLCKPPSTKLPITKYNMINFWMWTKQDTNLIWDLTKAAKRFQRFITQYNQDGSLDILKAGLLLRKIGKLWEHIKHLVVISMVIDSHTPQEISQIISDASLLNKLQTEIQFHQNSLIPFEQHLVSCHLLGQKPIWEVPILVNGAEISAMMGVEGKMLGEWVQKQIEWQILNPTKSKEDCIAWLKSLPLPAK